MAFTRLLLLGAALLAVGQANHALTPHGLSHRSLPGYQLRAKETGDGLCPNSSGLAGYLDIADGDKHHFFWLFDSRNNPENDPVILWMSGGPGCSSVGSGGFIELGACLADQNGNAVYNPHGWNNNATVIFLDQPVGVGYSYSSTEVSDVDTASEHSYDFLRLLFHAKPHLASRPFYIAGESFGGSWVTSLAAFIQTRQNSALGHLAGEASHLPQINLKGVMMGNAAVDDTLQWKGFYETACIGHTPLFNSSLCQVMQEGMPRCQNLLDTCKNIDFDMEACAPALELCRNSSVKLLLEALPGRNPYNFMEPCDDADSGLCYLQMGWAEKYLGRDDVRKALGVPDQIRFTSCNMDLNSRFTKRGETNKPHDRELTYLLNSGIQVLLYAGNQDWLCNSPGMRFLADEIPWSGNLAFRSQSMQTWHVRERLKMEAEPAAQHVLHEGRAKGVGTGKQCGGLTFLEIRGAGHLAPLDKGHETVEMINDWIQGHLKWA